jgi:hypothetical protein
MDPYAEYLQVSGAVEADSGGHLGIYGNIRPTLDSEGVFTDPCIDPETGEILSQKLDASGRRLERFALQSVARSILPGSQTAKCLRVPFRPGGLVDVLYSPSKSSASFGGLVTCHSVWSCPICAAKISERRRLEIQAAITAWELQGGAVVLLTLTHGHGPWDPLGVLVAAQDKALHRFFACRQGVDLMVSLGRVGHIRAREVTHGRLRKVSNGWHPHFHLLLFLRSPCLDLAEAEDRAFQVWHNACRLAGLPLPSRAYGVKLDDGSKAAQYVAKMGLEDPRGPWGLDSEMTKGHIKRAKDGETPFDFLRACLAGEDPQARVLFREFAAAFKGKNQLAWSRGLRDLFALGDITDEEIAAVQEEDAHVLASLSREDWRLVLRFDARGELIEIARHGRYEPLQRLLESLQAMKVHQ